MKISIVTISFNQRKYLQKCIDSILGQTGCELEYIVVDPGSTDGSRELIESYGEKIIQVFRADNGPADGLVNGFDRASGEVFGFINSDDYLLPGALKHISEYFNTKGCSGFVTGQGYTEYSNGHKSRVYPQRLTIENMLHRAAVIFQQSTFFPSVLYRQVGGFNTKNKTCWDYEFFLKLLRCGVLHTIIDSDIATFRVHENSISGSGRLHQSYLIELDRLFFECLGRERNFMDKLVTQYLRIKREALLALSKDRR